MAHIEIKVPDIGDFKEVEIIEVLVSPGDSLSVEQSLITVESDKASMEIPSSHAGKLISLSVKVGDKVGEGSVLGVIDAAPLVSASPPVAETPSSAEKITSSEAISASAVTSLGAMTVGAEGFVSAAPLCLCMHRLRLRHPPQPKRSRLRRPSQPRLLHR